MILSRILSATYSGIKSLLFSENVHGSARWLSYFERRDLLNTSNKGFVVDGVNKLSVKNSNVHLAAIGPTGAHKTSVVLFPSLLSLCEQGHSVVVTDPSGEIHQKSQSYLKKQGYNIKIIDVEDLSRSDRYNPLFRCKTVSDIEKISSTLVDTAFPSTGGDKFWNDGAKNIISLVIRMLKSKGSRFLNLYTLNHILLQLGGSPAQKAKIDKVASKELNAISFSNYEAFTAQNDKIQSSILSTAKTALAKINNPNLATLTLSETLNFEELRQHKTAIFIVIPEQSIKFYSFLLSLLYQQIIQFLMEMPRPNQPYKQVFLLLDEAGHYKIPELSTIISTIRKRKVGLMLILQNISQLEHIYGKSDAETILSNTLTHIYFPGMSINLAERLERTLGKKTVNFKESGFSKNDGSLPNRDKEMGRSLLYADEIRTLEDKVILIHGNKRPALLRITPWFKNPSLKRKVK
ncbi:MAG: VirD4-like conjugal transfer protein, CD1115 family [Saprospiraceae bacterium]